MTREHSDPRATIERFFHERAERVVAVWLFGSHARGEATAASDVDVAVLFTKPPGCRLEESTFLLQADLASALGTEVDLISMNDAPPELVRRVMREGELVLEVDRSRRIAFEVWARNVWWDTEPTLRRYWNTSWRPA